jgi:hypothetical protein
MRRGSEHPVRDRNPGVPTIRHDELTTERRPVVGVQENRATIRASRAPRHVVLDHEQIEQLVRRYDRRRTNIYEATLHAIQLRVLPKLVRVKHDLVTREPSGYDGPQ